MPRAMFILTVERPWNNSKAKSNALSPLRTCAFVELSHQPDKLHRYYCPSLTDQLDLGLAERVYVNPEAKCDFFEKTLAHPVDLGELALATVLPS